MGSGNWAVLMHMHSMGWGKEKEADSIFIFQLPNISVTSAHVVQISLVKSKRLKMKAGKTKHTDTTRTKTNPRTKQTKPPHIKRKSWVIKKTTEIKAEDIRFTKKLGCLQRSTTS